MEGPGRWQLRDEEHDSCALIVNVRKTGAPSHGNVKRTIEALVKMGHRSGEVAGEGDGCGLLTDLPRRIWARRLAVAGVSEDLAYDPRFAVGHAFIAPEHRQRAGELKAQMVQFLAARGVEVVVEQSGEVDSSALGKRGRREEPEFWQLALKVPRVAPERVDARLFDLAIELEAAYPVHFCSLSSHSVVYKVRGSAEVLSRYYPELRQPDFMSAITLGHNRYSTNTTSAFVRVQPFTLLGHNGEINTIKKLRQEFAMLGIDLVPGASDSQDLDRGLAGLIHHYRLSLTEAMEIVFPPIVNEVRQLAPELQDMYAFLRQAWGPFAQGPAAVVARFADEVVCSVDALGLRPLWFGETEKEFFFSSEKGAIPLETMVRDPKPLAPGEKIAVVVGRNRGVQILDYSTLQREVYVRLQRSGWQWEGARADLQCGGPAVPRVPPAGLAAPFPAVDAAADQERARAAGAVRQRLLAAWAWDYDDIALIEDLSGENPHEPIGSLGFDGPLAALSHERQNLSDFFKESVAVVTNPAIDREREIEHFSTRVVLGRRPSLSAGDQGSTAEGGAAARCELSAPVLLGGHAPVAGLSADAYRRLAREAGTWLVEDVCGEFPTQVVPVHRREGETVPQALDRLAGEALGAAREGAAVVVLDDAEAFLQGRRPLDPHLVVTAVDRALREERVGGLRFGAEGALQQGGESLRRRVGLVLRSAGIRNLHDLALAVGFGADAVNPYAMLDVALQGSASDPARALRHLFEGLRKGLEKVISTMGIHELRGYGRLASAIGLQPEVLAVFGTEGFCGSAGRGVGWERLAEMAEQRWQIAQGLAPAKPVRTFRFYPFIWKAAGAAAQDPAHYRAYERKVAELEAEHPISLRHCLELRGERDPIPLQDVDVGVGGHSLPFAISSMSFGSQGETAFRAYAEAAYRLNMVCLNGEGGEIKDMLRKYPNNRGQQIASGRFGVNVQLANSSNLLEIKIGQGAKPGEGGHLPGSKVSVKVAAARNARPGVDLISPSNNHDIYSIEDLAQIVEELKTANPHARVAVKVPVVPGIGTIAVGIAKAGADIVTLSGYDGGTGAARKHALRHVGLPVEIGVKEAHRALVASGLRERVEIWCDGGLKTAVDVAKMLCLGANRCGFGTLPMVAIGCTICRGCQLDTCHVGIATQMETREEAEKKGVKRFEPREFEAATEALCRLFGAMGEELRAITARLGFRRTQDLVGRSDLLHQVAALANLDLTELRAPVPGDRWLPSAVPVATSAPRAVHRPRNFLTQLVAELTTEVIEQGEELVSYEDDKINSADRAMGTYLSGEVTRGRFSGRFLHFRGARLSLNGGSIPGNGLAAFNSEGVDVRVEGGAQDGVGKAAFGGRVVILKGTNHQGERLDGSVGKGLAYGAQRGLFIVQGDADSRAGVRLSGADVVIGGELHGPVRDDLGALATRANVKGFAFEYMTGGRAVVLGDPGPWICSGMTGGVVYLRLQPEMGMDEKALRRRLAKGAAVEIVGLDARDGENLRELLLPYVEELRATDQRDAAERVAALLTDPASAFVKVRPRGQQVDPSVSTE
jgi:glutamate synthase (NADPH/NADH) large chain